MTLAARGGVQTMEPVTDSVVEHDEEDSEAPGWDAIDTCLEKLYPGTQPLHFGTAIPWSLGGPDPLNGISAYWRPLPIPHWHFVTYGFSELYEKESNDPDVSGYGFELTFRLAAGDDTSAPPHWAMNFLQNLARYVFKSGNVFADGHWMTANGPISLASATKICSMGFATDPELPAVDTPNGKLEFLQVVGLTLDEEHAAKRWKTKEMLNVFLPYMPMWVTDLERESMLNDPDIAALIDAGAQRDGSSNGFLFTDVLVIEERKRLLRTPITQVTLGAKQVDALIELIPLRLPFDRPFVLAGHELQLTFEPDEENTMTMHEHGLTLGMNEEGVKEFMSVLRPKEGLYTLSCLPGLQWKVQKTAIRDTDGNIIETFG